MNQGWVIPINKLPSPRMCEEEGRSLIVVHRLCTSGDRGTFVVHLVPF